MEGAILQVSVPTLVPCGCWATAGDTNAAASATPLSGIIHRRQSYMIGYRNDYAISSDSKFIADARRNLIAAKLLLEPDDAEIQDRYRIYKGLGLVLGVAVFEPREPVVREGVVETCSDRPTHARAVVTD
jgi:hypothetical protein